MKLTKTLKILVVVCLVLITTMVPTFAEEPELYAYNGVIPQGEYIFNGVGSDPVKLQIGVNDDADLLYGDWFTIDGQSCFLIDFSPVDQTYYYLYLPSWDILDALDINSPLTVLFDVEVTEDQYDAFRYYFTPSGVDPDPDPDSIDVYQTCYDLINTYIFGGNVEPGTYKDLVCMSLTTFFVILAFALPLIAIFFVIKLFF